MRHGPYTGVHCRLTLLSSTTRIPIRGSGPPSVRIAAVSGRRRCDYEYCPDDPRIVSSTAREAIATSSGQNDSGLFELNFRDERYLPFEFQGAISHWRIEMPPENNYFDFDTLSDLIINLNYTAREGGEMLRKVASECADRHLPGDGWGFFDVRHEFPDAWELFRDSFSGHKPAKELSIKLRRNLFPFVPRHRMLQISGLALLFETEEDDPHACHVVEFRRRDGYKDAGEGRHERKRFELQCVASAEWPRLYHGVSSAGAGEVGRIDDTGSLVFRFHDDLSRVSRVYLLCRYSVSCAIERAAGPASTSRRYFALSTT